MGPFNRTLNSQAVLSLNLKRDPLTMGYFDNFDNTTTTKDLIPNKLG
jgi:hypothetical protein